MRPSASLVVESLDHDGQLQQRLLLDVKGVHRGSFLLDGTAADVYRALLLAGFSKVTYRHNWKPEESLDQFSLKKSLDAADGYASMPVTGEYGEILLADQYFVGHDEFRLDIHVNGIGQWGRASTWMDMATLQTILEATGFTTSLVRRAATPFLEPELPLAA